MAAACKHMVASTETLGQLAQMPLGPHLLVEQLRLSAGND